MRPRKRSFVATGRAATPRAVASLRPPRLMYVGSVFVHKTLDEPGGLGRAVMVITHIDEDRVLYGYASDRTSYVRTLSRREFVQRYGPVTDRPAAR